MLSLDQPLGVAADLALFGDHADRQRVYVLPLRPRLARLDGVPEMSFVRFRGDDAGEGGVGLLSFTTELAPTEAQLQAAREHLQRQGLSEPRLVQPPWLGGKAVFAAALQAGDGFVETLLGEVTPDLAAGNRALFSMRLNEEGARLVQALVAVEGVSPLGVRYELQYAGLQPALQVRIEADYRRIHDELALGFQLGFAYEGIGVRASVESATQRLVEAGAIRIEVLQFSDAEDLRRRVDEAVRWIQERLLEDFFQTALQPPRQADPLQRLLEAARALGATVQDALNDASMATQLAQQLGLPVEALRRLAQGGGAGSGGTSQAGGAGAGGQSSFALKLQFTFRELHQEELRTLRFDWSEARAETRTAAPQGLLSQLGAVPQVVDAQDSGSFWDRMEVRVRPLGDFAALGVRRLVLQLAYPDETQPQAQRAFTFEPGQGEPQRFSAWTNGQPPRYRVRTEVHFDEAGPWPGSPVFTGEWRTQQSLELAVHPLSEVPRVELEIAPGTLQFEETPQAQVDVRIDGEPVATCRLTQAEPSTQVRRRLSALPAGAPAAAEGATGTTARPRVEARVTWFLASGERVEGDWAPVDTTTLLVHRPWRSVRSVRLVPLLPEDFMEALVTLTVAEPTRTVTVEQRFEAGDRRTRSAALPCLAERPPPVRIETLVIRGDGSTFIGMPLETDSPVAVIRDRDGAVRQVGVRLLAGTSLQVHGLMAVQVQLLDAAGAVQDDVVFTESRREPGLLLVPAEPDAPPASVRVTRYRLDGTAQVAPPQALPAAGELLVSAAAGA